MSQERLAVRPVAGGWMLDWPLIGPVLFLSGAAAERSARLLAERLTDLGHDATITITDRAGVLVSILHYYASL